jgi:hypothetical protein
MPINATFNNVVSYIVDVFLVLSMFGCVATIATFITIRVLRTQPIKLVIYLCVWYVFFLCLLLFSLHGSFPFSPIPFTLHLLYSSFPPSPTLSLKIPNTISQYILRPILLLPDVLHLRHRDVHTLGHDLPLLFPG